MTPDPISSSLSTSCSRRRCTCSSSPGPTPAARRWRSRRRGCSRRWRRRACTSRSTRDRGCRCSGRSLPTSATSSRSRPASAPSPATSPTWCRWTANLALPALVLLDEVGAGTDPVEGGALGIAVIDHFRRRGAHLIATTHYDSLKSYASTTEGVAGAAFGFNPETFAPTYRIVYGSPGRSLAIEIAARLGMPPSVIAAARENLTEPEKQLAEHLARIDNDLRALEQERRSARAGTRGHRRDRAEAAFARGRGPRARRQGPPAARRQARRPAARRAQRDRRRHRGPEDAGRRAVRAGGGATEERRAAPRGGLSTGDTGPLKADARAALDQIGHRVKGTEPAAARRRRRRRTGQIEVGSRVTVGALGLEGVVIELHGKHAEVDVRGKRLRAALARPAGH